MPDFSGRRRSVRQRLALMVFVIALPMLLLCGAIVWQLVEHQRNADRQAFMYAAQSTLTAVDALLGRYITLADALATSPSLQADDAAGFRTQAERALPGLPGAWVVLADPRGQELVNTFMPAGEQLPRISPPVQEDEARAFATRRPQFTDVIFGRIVKIPVVAVGIPVFHAGEPAYYLIIGIDVGVFRGLLNSQRLPDGWNAAMADRHGNLIARSQAGEWAGKPAAAGWRAVMKQDGFFEFPSIEGDVYTAANIVSPLSGWAIAIGQQKQVFEAPIRQTVILVGLAGWVVTLASILFAAWAARRIIVPIKALETGAQALQHRQRPAIAATGVLEVDLALQAFAAAADTLMAHETALRESEEEFRAFFHTAAVGTVELDLDGRIRRANERLSEITGYSGEELLGMTTAELTHPDDRRHEEPALTAYLAGQSAVYRVEKRYLRKDGRIVWVEVTAATFRDAAGRPLRSGGVIQDISERKRAEEALHDSEQRLQVAIEAADLGTWELDLTTDSAGIRSLRHDQIFGYDEPQPTWSQAIAERHVVEDDKATFRRAFERAAETGRLTCEVRVQWPDGSIHWISPLGRTYYDEAGKPVRMAGVVVDVSERRRAEEELRDSEERSRVLRAELLRASRLSEIGRMAAALAHELNQPLTAVVSYIGGSRRILAGDELDQMRRQKARKAMDQANVQALRAGDIIRRLREFIGSGQRERAIESAAVAMREASTLGIVDARHRGVSIRCDLDSDARVLIDRIQIQQVVVNLVRNAVEAMEASPRKELVIALAVAGDWVELSVSDTGAGVPPEMTDRLFKPFSSTKDHGMGIGLSVCREIVEAHDGRIWAEPNPGGGTIFRFTLPLVRAVTVA